MIVVRDVLQIAPESMKEAKEAAKELMALRKKGTGVRARILTDLVGDYYTLVVTLVVEAEVLAQVTDTVPPRGRPSLESCNGVRHLIRP